MCLLFAADKQPSFRAYGRCRGRSSGLYESGDVAAATVTAGVVALSFSSVTFGGVSLGRILMVLMVLTCAA